MIYPPTYIHESAQIGKDTKIGAFCDIGKDVVIGADCIIQCHVSISNGCRIGNHVFLGPGARLLNDKYPPSQQNDPVTIENRAVIGGGAIVLPNVKVGQGAVVGAGSVVTKDVGAYDVVAGNPAKKLYRRKGL